MHFTIIKSIKLRNLYSHLWKKKWFSNIYLKNHFFFFDLYQLNTKKYNSISICKIRNRCIINGKSRSVSSKYKLSRYFFKKYGVSGLLNGIVKF